MPLPQNELFEEFLSKTKIVPIKPKENYVPFDISNHLGSEAKVLYLSYPKISLSLDSMINRLISELKNNGHDANYEIALATLGIIVETNNSTTSAIEHANNCISNFHDAKLRHTIAHEGRKIPEKQLEIGIFKLGSFDLKNLIYWAKKCNCGYPETINKLNGAYSIESSFHTKLIDWDKQKGLKQAVNRWGTNLWITSIMDIYYQAIAKFYSDTIPYSIKEELQVLEAAALVHFDIHSLINGPFVHYISLFQWEKATGKGGWALYSLMRVLLLNYYTHDQYTNNIKWLENEIGFKALSNKKFDKAVSSFCRFLQRAHDHRLRGNQDEALLHFIIALDLVFGIEGNSTNSVCSRAAILVYRQTNHTFDQQVKILKRLYDSRSKYVHEGKTVKQSDLEEVEAICSEILWTLLATSGLGTFENIDVYLKQIDFVISAISAEKDITENEFNKIGIPPINYQRHPPSKVLKK